jgi:5-hydroxyisourate hydrolase
MGRLTTHVLDTMHGKPAAGMVVRLSRLGIEDVGTARTTNSDGRVDGPLLEGEALTAGTYELRFEAGAYFRSLGVPLAEPAFLETVVIRFGVADPDLHYHVPLLVSPYAYSTYRGS